MIVCRLAGTLAIMLTAGAASALPLPEQLKFPSLDRNAAGAPQMIDALYFRPANVAISTRVPAVVALHGCYGMFDARTGHEAELSVGMAARVQRLLDDGYAVLLPDSFEPRGHRQVCTIRRGEPTVSVAARRLDALGALAYLASLPGTDPARIALVGWSHGGSTTLAAINVRDPKVDAFRNAPGAPSFFRAAIAFYPSCAAARDAGARWEPGAPTRIYIGDLDDWTPAQACVQLGEAMRARDADVAVTVYPGAHHAFDAPGSRVVLLTEVPGGVHPGQGVHVGGQPQARAAVNDAVRDFLELHMHNARFPAYWRLP
jgi:dienelactone hydrolase